MVLMAALIPSTRSLILMSVPSLSPPSSSSSLAHSSNNKNSKRRRPRIPVLSYQNQWVCVNKPAGMSVYRGRGSKGQLVLQTTLKRQLRRKVFPVHRLDHRTSGALLLAFDSATAGALHHQLRHSKKVYVALLRGNWWDHYPPDVDHVTVSKPLSIDGVWKESVTEFHCLGTEVYNGKSDSEDDKANKSCTLVAAVPQTGRYHQIRRHAHSIGMPVIGDTQHGDTRVNRWWREQYNLNRLALHCLAMEGGDSASLSIVAPLPDDLLTVWSRLDCWGSAGEREPRLLHEWIDERGGTLGELKDWQIPDRIL